MLDFCKNRLAAHHHLYNYRNPAIHNYLISLYAHTGAEDKLQDFVREQGADPVFDLKYALRLCHELGLRRACVDIYSAMELYEEAVDLALNVDLDLAKAQAGKPADEDEKKRLWQRIARHVVENANDRKAYVSLFAVPPPLVLLLVLRRYC